MNYSQIECLDVDLHEGIKILLVAQFLHPAGVQTQENKQKDGERPKRRSSVTEEGERNTDNRSQADGHTNVDCQVEEQDAGHAVAIHAAENRALPLR